jgi:hypothetical protein
MNKKLWTYFFDFGKSKMPNTWRCALFFTPHIVLGVDKSQDLPSRIWLTLGDAQKCQIGKKN